MYHVFIPERMQHAHSWMGKRGSTWSLEGLRSQVALAVAPGRSNHAPLIPGQARCERKVACDPCDGKKAEEEEEGGREGGREGWRGRERE